MQWLPRDWAGVVEAKLVRLRSPRAMAVRTGVHHGLVALVTLVCLGFFARRVAPSYPIQKWLFWVYARLWLFCALFAAACISSGHAALGLLMPRGLSLRARAVYTAPVGVIVFFFTMFAGGLLGLYGPVFALVMPVLLIVAGAVPLHRRYTKVWPKIRAARRRVRAARPWWTWPVAAFGVVAVAAIYLSILTPGNVAFDSHFYHLGIAQQYAATHGISRSPEGWLCETIPHLASVLYTWALIAPGVPNVERVLLAGHIEFVLFLATLASLPVLVRWLVPGTRSGVAWAAMFVFPGIFLYDSSLSTAADHVAAFFAPAAYLALGQAFRELEWRRTALLAALLGGALLTKYQSIELILLPAAAVVVRAVQLVLRFRKDRARLFDVGRGVVGAIGAGLLVTAPHWLKNLIWYHDPLYPFLNAYFKGTPWSADAASAFNDYFEKSQVGNWRPKGTTMQKVTETFRAMFYFSFEPHDWTKFHGSVPVFGSLFTLGAFILTTLKKTKRLWGIYLGANLAILQWFWSMHQDRYLQVVVPWMAAAVAGTIALTWSLGWLPRLSIAALVAFQLVWGGDVYFIPGHAMLGQAPIKATADLLASGYKKKYEGRLQISGEFPRIAAYLPANAHLLLHEENRHLGLFRPIVTDFTPWQYGIRWGRLESLAAMDSLLHDLGVTHIVWRTGHSRNLDSIAGDLRFFNYVTNYAGAEKRMGGWSIATVAEEAPPETDEQVAYLGCGKHYERGMHPLPEMSVNEAWFQGKPKLIKASLVAPTDAAELPSFVKGAEFVVVGKGCRPAAPKLVGMVLVATRGKEQLYVRKRSKTAQAAPEAPTLPTDENDLAP